MQLRGAAQCSAPVLSGLLHHVLGMCGSRWRWLAACGCACQVLCTGLDGVYQSLLATAWLVYIDVCLDGPPHAVWCAMLACYVLVWNKCQL